MEGAAATTRDTGSALMLEDGNEGAKAAELPAQQKAALHWALRVLREMGLEAGLWLLHTSGLSELECVRTLYEP